MIPIIAVSMLGAGALEVGVINALGLSAFLVLGVPIGAWVDKLRRDREQVSDAHARLQSAASLVAIGSPSLAAALLGVIAAPFALVTAGISYALSALTLASIRVGADVKPPRHHEGFWPAARAGLSFTIRHPVLGGLFLSGMILNAAAMFGSAATAVYVLGVLGLSPVVFALLGTFAALGGLAASLAAPAILKHWGIGRTMILAGVACVPIVALTPLAAVLPWFPALWLGASTLGWAFLVVVISVAGAGIVPRIAPAHRLGMVMAGSRFFVLGIMPLASLAGGALAAWIGVLPVLWIWALLAGASAVPIVFSPMRTWQEFPAEADGGARLVTG